MKRLYTVIQPPEILKNKRAKRKWNAQILVNLCNNYSNTTSLEIPISELRQFNRYKSKLFIPFHQNLQNQPSKLGGGGGAERSFCSSLSLCLFSRFNYSKKNKKNVKNKFQDQYLNRRVVNSKEEDNSQWSANIQPQKLR